VPFIMCFGYCGQVGEREEKKDAGVNKDMKILFINYGRENLGIEYLSSVAKGKNYDVYLANDTGIFSKEDNVLYSPFLKTIFSREQKILESVERINPDVVGFSVYTTTYGWAVSMAKQIKKKKDVHIIFGGIHATLVPEYLLKETAIDYVVLGEAEDAFIELIQALEQGQSARKIANVWGRENNNVFRNDMRAPADINALPFPDKLLFKKELRIEDDYVLMASRGCPYNCSYCCESYLNKIYKGKYFRRRSVSSVMQELKTMKSIFSFKRVMFFDSILFTDKKWLVELLAEYKKEIRVPFRCTGHVNFLDEDIAKALKDAGCYSIDFGLQTFSQGIRMEVLNRVEDNAKVENAFKLCDKIRIRYDVDLMFGVPGMTQDDYKLPMRFLQDSRYLNRIKCYYLSYFPRLPIIDKAKGSGLLNEAEIDRINAGEIGDWFHVDSIKDRQHKILKVNFERLYKIYPLLPRSLKKCIMKYELHHFLRFVPGFLILGFQLLIGFLHSDYRFLIYIRNYLYNFKKLLNRRIS